MKKKGKKKARKDEFWEFVQKTSKKVSKWPAWKRGQRAVDAKVDGL